MALLPVVDERHLAEADPGDHPADEARLLGKRQEGVERAARHQPEVAGVEWDRRVGDAIEHAIEGRGGGELEHALAVALAADRIDHVGALRRHRRPHVGEQLGRVLEVGVDDQDLLARAQIEPGGERELVAMVARQVDRGSAAARRCITGQLVSREPSLIRTISYSVPTAAAAAAETRACSISRQASSL